MLTFLAFSGFYVLMATMPLYVCDLGGTAADVGIIMGTLSISAIICRFLIGEKLDIHGRKIFIIISLIIIFISNIFYFFSQNEISLIILRIFHGIGWGICTTANNTFVSDIIPVKKRGEGVGYWGIFNNLAMIIGPLTGLVILQQTNFDTLFLVSIGMSFVAIILSLFLKENKELYNGKKEKVKIEISKIIKPYLSYDILAPLLPLLFFSLTYGVILTFIPLFAIKVGIHNFGIFFSIYGFMVIIARLFTGRMSDKLGRKTIIIPGFIFAAIALLILAFIDILHFNVHIVFALMILSAVLYGISFAAIPAVLIALSMDMAPVNKRGIAMAAFGSAMDLGIGGGAFIFGLILDVSSFFTIFALSCGLTILGVFTIARMSLKKEDSLKIEIYES